MGTSAGFTASRQPPHPSGSHEGEQNACSKSRGSIQYLKEPARYFNGTSVFLYHQHTVCISTSLSVFFSFLRFPSLPLLSHKGPIAVQDNERNAFSIQQLVGTVNVLSVWRYARWQGLEPWSCLQTENGARVVRLCLGAGFAMRHIARIERRSVQRTNLLPVPGRVTCSFVFVRARGTGRRFVRLFIRCTRLPSVLAICLIAQ